MRPALPLLLALALLGGCQGNVVDHWRPKTSIMAGELNRFGAQGEQGACVGARLATNLSVLELRRLARAAARVPEGHFPGRALSLSDLVFAAGLVDGEGGDVRLRVAEAVEGCAFAAAPAQTVAAVPDAAAPAAPAGTPPAETPAPADTSRAGSVWLNLGAATSGQSIAVDGLSIQERGTSRQAWFRLTDPGAAAPIPRSYLLQIDCQARTINPMALRRHGEDWAVTAEEDHGPNGEGAAPIAGGTVMEIAFLALCT
jgi:hypothetical protein